jgi:hypothetical protein
MLSENKKEFPFFFPFSAHRCLRPKFLKSADAPHLFRRSAAALQAAAQLAQTAAHLLLSTAQLPKSARPPLTPSPAHLLTSFQPAPARIASPALPQPPRAHQGPSGAGRRQDSAGVRRPHAWTSVSSTASLRPILTRAPRPSPPPYLRRTAPERRRELPCAAAGPCKPRRRLPASRSAQEPPAPPFCARRRRRPRPALQSRQHRRSSAGPPPCRAGELAKRTTGVDSNSWPLPPTPAEGKQLHVLSSLFASDS